MGRWYHLMIDMQDQHKYPVNNDLKYYQMVEGNLFLSLFMQVDDY